jgi:hypothetical protein
MELEALKVISYVSAAMYIGGFSLVLFGAVKLARMEDE